MVRPLFRKADGTVEALCIFCQSADLDKQHVLGKAWRKVIPDKGGGQPHFGWFLDSDGTIVEVTDPKKRQAHFSRTAKIVCRECNGGWMRLLEERVFAFMEPVVRGERAELTPAELGDLAAWAAMQAVTIEMLDSPRQAVNVPFLRAIKHAGTNGSPPPQMLFWASTNTELSSSSMRTLIGGVTLPHDGCTGHLWRVTAIQLGGLGLISLHSPDGGVWEHILSRGEMSNLGQHIPRGQLRVTLDPADAISKDELWQRAEDLHRSFFPSGHPWARISF